MSVCAPIPHASMLQQPPPQNINAALPVSTPPGLEVIYNACNKIYSDQGNPLQVTAVVKYWLGGPDPLDYISMYHNKGDKEKNIPEHWHYVTFGFSDLHGDGRVHPTSQGSNPSGFGFELTMRLKKEPNESGPPTWPAELLQALARYVFQSENALYSGDHVSWHAPLDNTESRLRHMLMTDDPQLPFLSTPLGTISFIQVIGVCNEELKASQQWNGPGVIQLLKSVPLAGGEWLVTDMRRGETIFEINPTLQERVEEGIKEDGSNLSGVNARFMWTELIQDSTNEHLPPNMTEEVSNQIKDAFLQGLEKSKTTNALPIESLEYESGRKSSSDSLSHIIPHELVCTRNLEGVDLKFNLEAATLLPLACRGRISHGRHFTFKSVNGDMAVTLVSSGVEGAFVDEENPFAVRGPWLQVLILEEFAQTLLNELNELTALEPKHLPKHYSWPEHNLKISILPDSSFESQMPMLSFPT